MLYGKCALNFQYYELALKKLLPRLDRTVVLFGEEAEQVAAKGTLGLLITAFREVAFSFEGQRQRETREPGPEKEPRLALGIDLPKSSKLRNITLLRWHHLKTW